MYNVCVDSDSVTFPRVKNGKTKQEAHELHRSPEKQFLTVHKALIVPRCLVPKLVKICKVVFGKVFKNR